jgi:hypothetical protein
MNFLRVLWAPVPDDEYIARLRRSIRSLDRWRFWLILFYVVLLVAAISLLSKAIPLLIGLGQPGDVPFALLGFVTGAMFGLGFGWMFYGLVQGLISMLGGFRSERLLLKYHDAVNSPEFEAYQPPVPGNPFKDVHQRANGG